MFHPFALRVQVCAGAEMAHPELLIPLILSSIIISIHATGESEDWSEETIDLSKYKKGDEMLSLYELKTGKDPCNPIRIGTVLYSETDYTEVERALKCTAAINAFQSLDRKFHGRCRDFQRKEYKYQVNGWNDECIYGKLCNPGFCGVKVMVVKASCIASCPARTMEWYPLKTCIDHLKFSNFDPNVHSHKQMKKSTKLSIDSRDYQTGSAKEGMQYLFEVKNKQDPCKPLRLHLTGKKFITDFEETINRKCKHAVKALRSLPAESQGLCRNIIPAKTPWTDNSALPGPWSRFSFNEALGLQQGFRSRYLHRYRESLIHNNRKKGPQSPNPLERAYSRQEPQWPQSPERYSECVYGKDSEDAYCSVQILSRKPNSASSSDSPDWTLETIPLSMCLRNLVFYNFHQTSIIATDSTKKWPKATINLSDYTDERDRREIQYLNEIKKGQDPCAPLVSDVLLPAGSTYAEQDRENECGRAISAFRNLGADFQGPCQNFARNYALRDCIKGYDSNPGYCAVQILTKKPISSAGGILQQRLEWVPLAMCIEHLEFQP